MPRISVGIENGAPVEIHAPQIAAGNSFADSVGGGISQVATMLYNGAFLAGLELIGTSAGDTSRRCSEAPLAGPRWSA